MPRVTPEQLASLNEELDKITATPELRQKLGFELLKWLLLENPDFMKFYRPIRSMTLPQALESDYLMKMAPSYADALVAIVKGYSRDEEFMGVIANLAEIHKNHGITLSHFTSVVPVFTNTMASFLKTDKNKETMQTILSEALPMIGKRL
ncbi:unnamed protein product [Calicophoron daubneyi]